MHEHEAAGAVGVFDIARLQTRLAQQGRLLVAGHAANHWPCAFAQKAVLHLAKLRHRGLHLRQNRAGNIKQGQQFVVPLPSVDVEQQGAAGIADVGGVVLAACELPDQPCIDRAKGQFAPQGLSACTGNVVQQPAQLGGRKIRVQPQAGALLYQRLSALLSPLLAHRLGAPILPDDGVVQRQTGSAVPQQSGFALVGDAHAANV